MGEKPIHITKFDSYFGCEKSTAFSVFSFFRKSEKP